MDKSIQKYFEILEISPDATFEDAKAAYRLLSQIWHPDKHAYNKKLYVKATLKQKEINEAWDNVEIYYNKLASGAKQLVSLNLQNRPLSGASSFFSTADWSGLNDKSQDSTTVIKCPNCSTYLRLSKSSLSEARCSACGSYLDPTSHDGFKKEIQVADERDNTIIDRYTKLERENASRLDVVQLSKVGISPDSDQVSAGDDSNKNTVHMDFIQMGLVYYAREARERAAKSEIVKQKNEKANKLLQRLDPIRKKNLERGSNSNARSDDKSSYLALGLMGLVGIGAVVTVLDPRPYQAILKSDYELTGQKDSNQADQVSHDNRKQVKINSTNPLVYGRMYQAKVLQVIDGGEYSFVQSQIKETGDIVWIASLSDINHPGEFDPGNLIEFPYSKPLQKYTHKSIGKAFGKTFENVVFTSDIRMGSQ